MKQTLTSQLADSIFIYRSRTLDYKAHEILQSQTFDWVCVMHPLDVLKAKGNVASARRRR